jgi:imidazolonepropionase
MVADLVVHNTCEILTCAGPAPRRGAAQRLASPIADGVVASLQGRIVFVGAEAEWRRVGSLTRDAVLVDAARGAVVPGFVDAHTHVVYAGDRRDELRRRLAGATYSQIAAEGGGILATVAATRNASVDDLCAAARPRLAEMLACGTTTAEAKSGYGLTTQSELTILRAIRALDSQQPVELAPTFMGAHDIPPEFKRRPGDYVALVCREMLPAVAAEGLAEWCDVFCEAGVFDASQSHEILSEARRWGMKPRIHADELAPSGGSLVAARVAARSADHLLFVDEAAADALSAAGTVATLLPAASLFLKIGRFAPARMLVDRGVAVALATDLNPGGGFSPSMPFVLSLACFALGMTFEEALIGATLNAAYSLDRHERIGSLEPGKQLDAVVVNGPALDLVRAGAATIRTVIKKGRIIDRTQANPT